MTERPASPTSPPAPAHDGVLVGREREQAALRDALAAARAGCGSLVLISGEAGIGKTTLAVALGHEASGRGALVLIGRCYDLSETPPYGPWIDLFRQLASTATSPPPPDLAGAAQGAGRASQALIFGQARDSLATAAAGVPLVLILDDLHWADDDSVELLRFLAREAAGLPLLVLVTYRGDELPRHHRLYRLLPTLVRESAAVRLTLRPLVAADMRAIVESRYRLPTEEAARLAAYLEGRAEGNPFYAGELLHTLEEEGVLRASDAGWTLGDLAELRVPSLLRQVVETRIARLGKGAREPLALAAVIGQEVPLPLWAAVTGHAEDELLDLIEPAVEARLLDHSLDGTRAAFTHALIREALYEAIAPARRRAWHRRAGESLLALADPDPDQVAYHLRQAGDGRAKEWLVRAGMRAGRAAAMLTAAARFEAALSLVAPDDATAAERGWLHYRAAMARRFAEPQVAIDHFAAAGRLADTARDQTLAALALFHRGFYRCMIGAFPRGLPELEAGVAALDLVSSAEDTPRDRLMAEDLLPEGNVERAGHLAIQLALSGRDEVAYARGAPLVARLSAAPAEVAAERPNPGNHGDASVAVGVVSLGRGEPMEARRAFGLAREVYLAGGYYVPHAWAWMCELSWVVLPYLADEPAERRRCAAATEAAFVLARGAQRDFPPHAARLPLQRLEGEWTAAREAALAIRATHRTDTWWHLFGAGELAALAREQGDTDLAWALVGEELPEGLGTQPGSTYFAPALIMQRTAALLALDAGDTATARAWLQEHDRWRAWNGGAHGRVEGHLAWAAYARRAGDVALAAQHAERALAYAAEPRQPLALLAAHRLLGELATEAGRHADAQAHLDAALVLADACAVPYERALTLLDRAEYHAAQHDAAAALADLAIVRAVCTPLGAQPALARADALAARLALPVTPAPPVYPGGLSEREAEVLRLVARGLSNAEVAAQLFLSPRTVNTHLTNIYTKLNVDGRPAAIRVALDHGLR